MFDWDRMESHRRHFSEFAKKANPGLPREHLTPGALVTLSACKCTGDRSYSHDVWEILAANEGHASIRKINARDGSFGSEPCIVSIQEHEFYGAEHLLPVKATLHVVASGE
jgi:hypothetical protein